MPAANWTVSVASPDPLRRLHLQGLLAEYAQGEMASTFDCALDEQTLWTVVDLLQAWLNPEEDRILLAPLSGQGQVLCLGAPLVLGTPMRAGL